MGNVINDHIVMVNGRGQKKAVPCWQIKLWIRGEVFDPALEKGNKVGWDFADPASAKRDYGSWLADQARKDAIRKANINRPAVPANAGIAGAMQVAREREAVAEWDTPPIPDPGDETIDTSGAVKRSEPRDII